MSENALSFFVRHLFISVFALYDYYSRVIYVAILSMTQALAKTSSSQYISLKYFAALNYNIVLSEMKHNQ